MIQTRRVEKPWGYELWWAVTDRYVGKLLFIKKGCSLSYQYHEVKDESMYVHSGSVYVELEEDGSSEVKRLTLGPGDSIRLSPLTKHRMRALADSELFEVSTPELDDIVRIEDDYGRA